MMDPSNDGANHKTAGLEVRDASIEDAAPGMPSPREGKRISFIAWGAAGVVSLGLWALILRFG